MHILQTQGKDFGSVTPEELEKRTDNAGALQKMYKRESEELAKSIRGSKAERRRKEVAGRRYNLAHYLQEENLMKENERQLMKAHDDLQKW
jgi:hypothetical protein